MNGNDPCWQPDHCGWFCSVPLRPGGAGERQRSPAAERSEGTKPLRGLAVGCICLLELTQCWVQQAGEILYPVVSLAVLFNFSGTFTKLKDVAHVSLPLRAIRRGSLPFVVLAIERQPGLHYRVDFL